MIPRPSLALVYGSWKPVQKLIDSLGSLTFYTIYGNEQFKIPINSEEIIFVSENFDPMKIPEFLVCFNNRASSSYYNKLAWVVQGSRDKLIDLELFNPDVIVTEEESKAIVQIGSEIREMDLSMSKMPVTLYLRPKSNSAKKIIMDIMPKMEKIKEQYDFTLASVGDDTATAPSSISATPALVTQNGIIYTSDAIIKYLLQ